MKAYAEFGFLLLLGGMLLAIWHFLGPGVLALATLFSAIWFVISMVLLTRPPGIPEFIPERPGSDEQYVVRRDIFPKLTVTERLRLSLGVACGSCLLVWLTLAVLAR
ncbi:MAG: hypothetical protein R3C53_10435 [Pirellulaceae bacterium]